jgi:hypothetical protein
MYALFVFFSFIFFFLFLFLFLFFISFFHSFHCSQVDTCRRMKEITLRWAKRLRYHSVLWFDLSCCLLTPRLHQLSNRWWAILLWLIWWLPIIAMYASHCFFCLVLFFFCFFFVFFLPFFSCCFVVCQFIAGSRSQSARLCLYSSKLWFDRGILWCVAKCLLFSGIVSSALLVWVVLDSNS